MSHFGVILGAKLRCYENFSVRYRYDLAGANHAGDNAFAEG